MARCSRPVAGVAGLDGGDQVLQQVLLEVLKALTASGVKGFCGTVIGQRAAIKQHGDEGAPPGRRPGEVVEHRVSFDVARPPMLVAADAVQQVEHGYFLSAL